MPCSGTKGKHELLKALIARSNVSPDIPENPLARTLILNAKSILTRSIDKYFPTPAE